MNIATESSAEELLETEIGKRAFQYMKIENSAWAYHLWFMTARWWWDDDSRTWIRETRPEMLAFT